MGIKQGKFSELIYNDVASTVLLWRIINRNGRHVTQTDNDVMICDVKEIYRSMSKRENIARKITVAVREFTFVFCTIGSICAIPFRVHWVSGVHRLHFLGFKHDWRYSHSLNLQKQFVSEFCWIHAVWTAGVLKIGTSVHCGSLYLQRLSVCSGNIDYQDLWAVRSHWL